jgi:hypothetical protein
VVEASFRQHNADPEVAALEITIVADPGASGSTVWRDGRVAEGGGLLNSNPSLRKSPKYKLYNGLKG